MRTSPDFEDVGLYVADADGSRPRRIADNIDSYSTPAWSPDGRRIAYMSGGDMILLVNPNSGRQTRRVPTPAVVNCGAPAWSPDGRRFALVCAGVNTPTDPRYLRGVYVMNVDGTDLRRVVEDTGAASPTWSPDGTTIAFAGVSCHPPGWDVICAVEADGSGLRELTPRHRAESSSPHWSTTRAPST